MSTSGLPLRLTNGSSRGPSVTNSERQKLAASIESTNSRAIDLENHNSNHNGEHDDKREYFNKSNPPKSLGLELLHGKSKLSEAAESLDSSTRSGAASPRPSRPASPYTANPPVDFDGLSWPSLGTRARLEATQEESEARLEKLQGAVRTILECIGEDPEREGLKGTPERYAKAMLFFTKGYEENVRDLVHGAVFNEDHDELVIVRDIEVYSLCEHHMVPFTGKMHIGYIPNRRVLGLSKLARLAEMFARRLQVQERLTKQVALAIAEVLKPLGVAVVMESSHFCMVMRGVQKAGAVTTTSCMLGVLRNSAKTREEFLSLLNRR